MRIKELRKQINKTQKDLANLTGYRQTLVSKWENNEREPDIATLKKLANYFNVSIDYLVENETDTTQIQLQPQYTPQQKNCIDMLMQLDEDLLNMAEVYLSGLSGRAETFRLKKI